MIQVSNGIFQRLLDGETVRAVRKEAPRTLYVSRPVENAEEIIVWAKEQGFETTLPPDEMHVTIAFSKNPVDWSGLPETNVQGIRNFPYDGSRDVIPLGSEGAVVLGLESDVLTARWQELVDAGASWDHDGYRPHITLSFQAGDVDLDQVEPYGGVVVLGPEVWEEIEDDWHSGIVEKSRIRVSVQKLHEEEQIAYGWASVIEKGGREVVDHDKDIITEEELAQFATRFVLEDCGGKEMHEGARVSELVESMMFTKEKQDILGIDLGKVGWWIGMKYHDAAVWAKIKSGELPMFSIGFDARRRKRG